MIKSLHKLLVASREKDFAALVDFFDQLGLARGEAWQERHSRGVKLLAPTAGVEIGMGKGFPGADLVVEVDSADTAYEAAKRNRLVIAEDIADYECGARLFILEMPAGAGRLAIFSYNESSPGRTLEGALDARGKRFAVVVGRFNSFITERLLAGALDGLHRCGAARDAVQIVRVPGSFEIPAAARKLARTARYDAILCLGCLLRGDTAHYDVIANQVTRGIGQSAEQTGVPHAFGVLTCDTLEQAIDRAGLKGGNKGFDAALAAVEMANLDIRPRTAAAGKRAKRKTPAPRKRR
jgi:6,7-dimethyl-8-ribityllumazine synthase